MAKAVGAVLVVIHCDSQVVVGHINGDYKARRIDEGIPKHGQRKEK